MTRAAKTSTAVPRRGRLLIKYVLAVAGLVSLVLIGNSTSDLWVSYNEAKQTLVGIQQEKAKSAAGRISEFVDEIERQIGWTTYARWEAGSVDQRHLDYVRLMRQVPAITELAELDSEGHEQLKVSRLAMDTVGSGTDYSQEPKFKEAVAKEIWFSAVYFRKASEPYMTIAVARAGQNAGVTVAEVNLKLIWDVISAIKVGQPDMRMSWDRTAASSPIPTSAWSCGTPISPPCPRWRQPSLTPPPSAIPPRP